MKIAIKINGDIEIEFHIFSTQRSSSMAQAILHFLLLRIFFSDDERRDLGVLWTICRCSRLAFLFFFFAFETGFLLNAGMRRRKSIFEQLKSASLRKFIKRTVQVKPSTQVRDRFEAIYWLKLAIHGSTCFCSWNSKQWKVIFEGRRWNHHEFFLPFCALIKLLCSRLFTLRR